MRIGGKKKKKLVGFVIYRQARRKVHWCSENSPGSVDHSADLKKCYFTWSLDFHEHERSSECRREGIRAFSDFCHEQWSGDISPHRRNILFGQNVSLRLCNRHCSGTDSTASLCKHWCRESELFLDVNSVSIHRHTAQGSRKHHCTRKSKASRRFFRPPLNKLGSPLCRPSQSLSILQYTLPSRRPATTKDNIRATGKPCSISRLQIVAITSLVFVRDRHCRHALK